MKNIKSFEEFVNESQDVNLITESVSDDVEAFKKKFAKKLKDNQDLSNFYEKILSAKGKTKIWKVYEGDDYGREVTLLGLFNGISSQHARIRASVILNNMEIYSTGFYGAEEISTSDIKSKIKGLESKLDKLKSIQ